MTSSVQQTSFTPSAEEVAQFHERGYLGPFKVYEVEEMKRLWRRERLRLMDRSSAVYDEGDAKAGNTNIANYDRHLDSTFLADHICRRDRRPGHRGARAERTVLALGVLPQVPG